MDYKKKNDEQHAAFSCCFQHLKCIDEKAAEESSTAAEEERSTNSSSCKSSLNKGSSCKLKGKLSKAAKVINRVIQVKQQQHKGCLVLLNKDEAKEFYLPGVKEPCLQSQGESLVRRRSTMLDALVKANCVKENELLMRRGNYGTRPQASRTTKSRKIMMQTKMAPLHYSGQRDLQNVRQVSPKVVMGTAQQPQKDPYALMMSYIETQSSSIPKEIKIPIPASNALHNYLAQATATSMSPLERKSFYAKGA